MTLLILIIRSLRYHWRSGLAILAGVAVATAVITGSLLVGDSVNGSVRDTALARLGEINAALLAPTFFREDLAAELAGEANVARARQQIVPLILVHGAVNKSTSQSTVPNVNAIGIDDGFWRCFPRTTAPALQGRDAAVNAALARDLHLTIGDYLLLTVERQSDAPGDSLFARRSREETTRTLRLHVTAILPDIGAGGFALQASTTIPRNIFIARDWLASRLDRPAQINALLAASPSQHTAPIDALQRALAAKCTLGDYGLTLDSSLAAGGMAVPTMKDEVLHRQDVRATDEPLLALHSTGVVMNEATVQAARQAAITCGGSAAPASVYLATTISRDAAPTRHIAYAILAGVDSATQLPVSEGGMPLDDDSLLLNQWAASDLGAHAGDHLTVRYLTPSWDGAYRPAQRAFTCRGIVPLAGLAANPGLAPNFEGITSVQRIEDWNPPFPIDITQVTARDEAYWAQYHTTPKAYISLAVARDLWQQGDAGKQAAWITTITLQPPAEADLTKWASDFSAAMLPVLPPAEAGLLFLPVRRQALASAESPTDFGQLFLAMSFFLVLSAAGMAGMLMRLLIERRTATIGMMQACGLPRRLIIRAILGEALLLTASGTAIGMPLGLCYARELIVLLSTRWTALIGTATLWLHVTPSSLLIGAIAGLLTGIIATGWGLLRLLRERNVLLLLAGSDGAELWRPARRHQHAWIGIIVLLFAVGCCITTAILRLLPAPLSFFLAGFLLLLAGLWFCHLRLAYVARKPRPPSWRWFADRNAAANRKRSLLTIGLLAGASFLLVTVAANSNDFGHIDMSDKRSGTGGFTLRALASVPIGDDFGTPSGREQLGFAPEDDAAFTHTRVFPFLMSPGGDISCLNITRPPAPRLLGVPPEMIARGGFSVTPLTGKHTDNPWRLLETPLSDGCIPAFGDADSVRWTLHADLGEVYTIPGEDGRPRRLRFVGLLSGSIFAGELLVSRDNFKTLYPAQTSPRLFLLESPLGDLPKLTDALRANLSTMGMEVNSTGELLTRYLSVQQTYLSTFLTLGGLGLLLGVLGIVVTVLHSAFDRRKSFALLTAIGFRRAVLLRLLLTEHLRLLLSGVTCGAAAALVASIPLLTAPETHMHWFPVTAMLAGMLLIGAIASAIAGWCALGENLLEGLRSE